MHLLAVQINIFKRAMKHAEHPQSKNAPFLKTENIYIFKIYKFIYIH